MDPSTPTRLTRAIIVLLAAAPSLAAACGGFFCDAAQPVNQAAERILFARHPDDATRMQMHVQINYKGPPTEFGWLLPVPPDVETMVGLDDIFTRLDMFSAP